MADGEPRISAAEPVASRRKLPEPVSEDGTGQPDSRDGQRRSSWTTSASTSAFRPRYSKEEWNLSMSAVLSENGNAIWVMAWLDPCPRTAVEVPRTALLKLLAKNDTMGNGKFFAYIPANNRFVLERVLPNENITTAKFREVLQDLGAGVVETYPYWSVANWKQPDRSKGKAACPRTARGRPGATGRGTTRDGRRSGRQRLSSRGRLSDCRIEQFPIDQSTPTTKTPELRLGRFFNAPVKCCASAGR